MANPIPPLNAIGKAPLDKELRQDRAIRRTECLTQADLLCPLP